MKVLTRILSIFLVLLVLVGCELGDSIKHEAKNEFKNQSKKAVDELKHKAFEKNTPIIKNNDEDKALIGAETNSENYAFVNRNKADLTQEERDLIAQKGQNFWADYSNLDKLGRAGEVTALITSEAVQSHSSKTQKRPSFDSDVHLAGEYKDGKYNSLKQTWEGYQTNNQILQLEGYRGYLYNKSHMLAWSLGGDMKTHNLILGTRAQNVGTNKDSEGGGMGYPETQIRNAMYNKPETKVFYKVTPVYQGEELIARGTHVKAYSINDDGKTINLNVWISNKQNGVNIDYTDGSYKQY
ncbi:DNA/RNA non-specific endonuclease (plasmid) [Staphylococcus aureus]|uniref:DNA/RNA non-specific endonuclease n=1 Tax=Staphylococcus aureus TaxID=1280 RepID=UPI000BA5EC0B|nr:DNA/RNA non-specific endonuclease [Staphylococcus aureus]EHS7180685.1 DNA/RNA non-specific endonuclease [Staphylococcus pseudintermedius]PAJ49890.1 endonuclease [Staphylococcus aureus]ULW18151.1 DNA/RNA non-specific endonuclease [Staphylococcus aureus]BBL19081.1 hypothetical protein SAJRA307_P0330 [Staphylococcus aureus]HAR6425142.1 endonuclease [Staphylococcus pseudintermedius]